MIRVKIIMVKSVLNKSNLPASDYVINPYVGCGFGCRYCYASFIGRWKHPGEEWGNFVDVKINAPEIFNKELEKKKSRNFGSIFFSSVTDPYQPVEGKYQITRKCLTVLANYQHQGLISVLTKSPLVLRDVEIFKKIKNITVGLTIILLSMTQYPIIWSFALPFLNKD